MIAFMGWRVSPQAGDPSGMPTEASGVSRSNNMREVTMSTVRHADTPESFQTEVLESPVPVVVDFWAEWCGPCRMVVPELEKLDSELGDSIRIVKVNIDDNPGAAGNYGVMSIPTIGLFEDGKLTQTAVGAMPAAAIEERLGLARFRSEDATT
jgi:thioredoxin 1